VQVTRIGHITAEPGLCIEDEAGRRRLEKKGWVHNVPT
jgi:hypothetical protein